MNALSWRAERAFLKAWPALSTNTRNGWQARFANGLSRRANSVNPLIANAALDDADIRFFADAYRAQNLPLIVRVPTLLDARVDDALARSGFTQEGECCVLHGMLDAVTTQPDPAIEIIETLSCEWLDAVHAAQGRASEQRAVYEALINAIALPAGFVMLRVRGEPVALAYGAIDGDLLCVESVVTAAFRRGKGHAKRLMAALLHWAKAKGAATACLQVEMSNAPALALYRRIGLGGELYRYHYRRQRPAQA
ncbi:MAG: GNAT family N-acetyltransferase [Xanthobacteraceae bacterium]|nr:GNAT family N-acetyltransferase [Xanthobacteraceae bacterium]